MVYNNNQENSIQDKYSLALNKLIIQDYSKSLNNLHLIILYGQSYTDGIRILKFGWIINFKLSMQMPHKNLFKKASEIL
jgi:hypothetical protein